MLRARAVVVPSPLFETFGLVAVEAMAAGTPVLTVSGSAPASVVAEGGPAPVALSDPQEWAHQLAALADGDAVDAWGLAARIRYELEFTPDRGLERLLAVYDTARARRTGRP
jgi:glycosyltransferase involved in cell wall biosynthesis